MISSLPVYFHVSLSGYMNTIRSDTIYARVGDISAKSCDLCPGKSVFSFLSLSCVLKVPVTSLYTVYEIFYHC
jgi:hypothetical protein